MSQKNLKYRIDKIISDLNEFYRPDKFLVTKLITKYYQLMREFDFNLATFGGEILIQYFNSWSNKERFGKLEYYSNIIASGGESRGELFVLYATVKINEAIISYLRSLPEDINDESKKISNKVLFNLQRSIEHLNSISDKLEVLKEFYEQQIESRVEVPEIFRDTPIGHVAFLPKYREEVENICFEFFPEANRLYTTLCIPDRLFQFNFKFVQDEPEFTFWFLKYNAKNHFDSYIMCDIYEDLESPLRREHVMGYLQDLENEMGVVKELVSRHMIHSDKDSLEYARETELLRIIEGYYEVNPLNEVFAKDNLTVIQYARHVSLKEYLVSLQIEQKVSNTKTLAEYFADPTQYHTIMDILVKAGKCHVDTHLWIDNESGSKRHLAELLTILHTKGYYLSNRRMENAEKRAVALSTFGVKFSIDTAKRSSKPSEKEFKYIPLASKISDPE